MFEIIVFASNGRFFGALAFIYLHLLLPLLFDLHFRLLSITCYGQSSPLRHPLSSILGVAIATVVCRYRGCHGNSSPLRYPLQPS